MQKAAKADGLHAHHRRGHWSSSAQPAPPTYPASCLCLSPSKSAAARAARPPAEAGPSKTPRAQHPLALVGKLLQQLKKDTLQNICEDLKEPVSGNKEELIIRIADAM